jgi:hypothetical protein
MRSGATESLLLPPAPPASALAPPTSAPALSARVSIKHPARGLAYIFHYGHACPPRCPSSTSNTARSRQCSSVSCGTASLRFLSVPRKSTESHCRSTFALNLTRISSAASTLMDPPARCVRAVAMSCPLAFSCKKRGLCPSCNGRRMCDTAARLVDNVLPDIRLRQWVLSIPFELRIVLAKRSDVLNACGRIFVQEIFRWQRRVALLRGYKQAKGAAINFPQRFGRSATLEPLTAEQNCGRTSRLPAEVSHC